ncbi:HEMB [Symbiodinium natans]|uniref:Delta-aminolevulinic acid dehydratase n=1 Tax=Symbiodinium natans TaxID=878477 RepID=A0A812J9B5_9DINO|nr:HEMB [Symbiodinium natans]
MLLDEAQDASGSACDECPGQSAAQAAQATDDMPTENEAETMSATTESQDDGEWTVEDDEEWQKDTQRDYYEALGLPHSGGKSISSSRVRAAYHHMVQKWHPDFQEAEAGNGPQRTRREVLRRFWLITEAYLVLKDPERRRIYDECGFACFKQSESCYEQPVFEQDAYQVYEDFFNGTDPEARDFMLMNGGAADSSESDDSMEEGDLAVGPERAEKRQAEASEPQLPPEVAKAVGVEATSSVEQEFRSMLNGVLSSMPCRDSGKGGEHEGCQHVEAKARSRMQRRSGARRAHDSSVCKAWKYWRGAKLRRRQPGGNRHLKARRGSAPVRQEDAPCQQDAPCLHELSACEADLLAEQGLDENPRDADPLRVVDRLARLLPTVGSGVEGQGVEQPTTLHQHHEAQEVHLEVHLHSGQASTGSPAAVGAAAATVAGFALAARSRKQRAGKAQTPRHFFGDVETKTPVAEEEVATSVTQHPEGSRIPEGTPVPHPMAIRKRPRRNRRLPAQRHMFSETRLTAANFILPIFVHEGTEDIPISSMPDVSRVGVDTGLLREVEEAVKLGVKSVVIFPKTPDELKTQTAEECFNPAGLAQRAIRNVKQAFPDVVVYTDVALDPYNSLGHDGIVRSDGVILNDETIAYLCKQAVSQAEAGADYVSPSDMMDGRVGAIRDALDEAGFTNVGIMAYSAKYASAFYGPFREALDSNPVIAEDWKVPKGKETYQQDPANYKEALLEAALDEEEGADILMVKPAMPYLDIIKGLHEQSNLPIAAYHVSGEYAMLKAAALNGWLDEKAVVLEALLSIRRAGATVILTYYAKQAARWLQEEDA